MRKRFVVFSFLSRTLLAQSPAPVKPAPIVVPPLLQQYDFGAQVKELQNPTSPTFAILMA